MYRMIGAEEWKVGWTATDTGVSAYGRRHRRDIKEEPR
jgi:hypothetical protein